MYLCVLVPRSLSFYIVQLKVFARQKFRSTHLHLHYRNIAHAVKITIYTNYATINVGQEIYRIKTFTHESMGR